jgi:excinuclease UvrABC helicase subunit UvrB
MIGNSDMLQLLDLEEAFNETYSVPSKVAQYNWENGLVTQHTTQQLKDRIKILKIVNVAMQHDVKEITAEHPKMWKFIPQFNLQIRENTDRIAKYEKIIDERQHIKSFNLPVFE